MTHDCQQTWERALDARRGELSELERLRLEEELAACDRCARRAGRVCALLDEASDEAQGAWHAAAADTDARFAQLMGALDDAPAAEEPQEATPRLTSARAAWALAAAASLAALVAGWGWWSARAPSSPAPAAPPRMARATGTPPAVGVYADEGARWTLGEGPAHELRLTQGAALVDFVPVGQDTLSLRAGDVHARVVGTVVYLSVEDPARPLVAVLVGEVELSAPGQPPRRLREGEAAQGPALSPATLPDALVARADALIDLERHRRLTARLRAESPAPTEVAEAAPAEVAEVARAAPPRRTAPRVARPAPVAPAPVEPAPVEVPPAQPSLEEEAREALRRNEHLRAAALHERWLAQVPSTSAQAATLRLELTRLYLHRLGRRREAIAHLRGLLQNNPDDLASPQARRQLCELLGEDARDEPLCALISPPPPARVPTRATPSTSGGGRRSR
jgi:ferric-dicitrate binding protein FerR (iron transport regulator)